MNANLNKFHRTEAFFLFSIAIASIAIMLPVLLYGIPVGYDLPHHYQCAITFVESIKSGDLYPSWSLERNFGFGGMESRLYPPISHYALALAYLTFCDWLFASWFTFTIFTFLGGLGVYLWAKEYVPSPQALFGAILYILLPYHLNQLYNTFFYAEYVGNCVLPFCFLFLSKVCRRGRNSDILGLAISFAVLILTHLPLTVIGSFCLVIYGLTMLKKEQLLRQVVKLSVAVAAGLAASSFFWLKVIFERDLMAKTLIYSDPWLDYRFHFLLTITQTVEGELFERIYDSATFYYDAMFITTVLFVIVCTIPFLIVEKSSKFSMKGVWLIFGCSAFLIIPASSFIWDSLPILQEVQFPWRWIGVVSIFGSVLAASQINFLIDWFRDRKRPFALMIFGCILVIISISLFQIVRGSIHLEKDGTEAMMQKSAKDIGFTFWWTIWTRKEAFENKEKVTVKNREVRITEWSAENREFMVEAGNETEARLALFYHPNWQAIVNGSPVEIKPDENGAILIPLTAQKSLVRVAFIESLALQICSWISVAFWLGLFCIGIPKLLKSTVFKSHKEKTPVEFWQLLSKIYDFPTRRGRIFLIPLAALVSLFPMIFIGVFNGGDLYQHLQFAETFRISITDRNFYPSWGGFENNGYGSNGVRFYPPAMPFLLGLMRIVAGTWQSAGVFALLIVTIIGGLGVYLWAKEYLPSEKAIWAGVIFIFMPYRLIEIHNASMYAEFAGMSVIPFSFLFLTRVCNRGNWSDVIGLAIAYGALVLTHLPTTVIGSFSLFVYGLLILPKDKILSTLTKLGVAVGLGLAASSVYWCRMVFERDWMRITKFWKDDHFDYRINFLLTSPWIDNRQLWFFNLVLLTLAFFVAGCAVAIYHKNRKSDKKRLFGVILLFAMSIMMMTIISKPVWAIVPYLHEVQFPWRWLTIASVCGSVLIAVGIESSRRLACESEALKTKVKVFALNVFLFFGVLYLIVFIGFQNFRIPSENYESWAVEKAQGMGEEWFWTPLNNRSAFKLGEKVLASERHVEISQWNPESRIFTVDAGTPTQIRVATIYYPFWEATINGMPVEIGPDHDGMISIPIDEKKSEVRLEFVDPPIVENAQWISGMTWLLLLPSFLFINLRKVS